MILTDNSIVMHHGQPKGCEKMSPVFHIAALVVHGFLVNSAASGAGERLLDRLNLK